MAHSSEKKSNLYVRTSRRRSHFLLFDTKPKMALHVLYTLEWQGGANEVLRRTVCSSRNGRNIHTKHGPKGNRGVVLLLI
jgi:hypothetical protein